MGSVWVEVADITLGPWFGGGAARCRKKGVGPHIQQEIHQVKRLWSISELCGRSQTKGHKVPANRLRKLSKG